VNAETLNILAQLFDRDTATNEMLWFSGPPLDVARTPALNYSLDYLYYLAVEKKRKAGERVDGELLPAQKRPRIVHQAVTDILQTVYEDIH
jgi:chromatin structure-remodeling complex subunit RSC1/2